MVFLTGASGFIGSHLLRGAAGPFRFRCLVRPGSVNKILKNPSVEIVEGNLLSEDAVKIAMQGADTVLHLGALVRTSSAEEIYRVNVEGTRRVVSEAMKQKVSRLIFVSTENAMREDLSDAYASSKREAENVVKDFKNHLILRPCFVYGEGDDHGLGRLVALAQKSPVVPLFGGLQGRIQPLYILDMVDYLIKALERPLTGEYMLAGPETLSLNDFIRQACEFGPKQKPQIVLPRIFFKLAALACAPLPASIGWGPNQYKNIYYSRTYSIEKTVKDFGLAPRPVREGLTQWLSADKGLQKTVAEETRQ